jgi:antirestriction protein ArdC
MAYRRGVRPAKPQVPQRELDWTKMIEVALTLPGSTGDTYCRFYEYSFLNQILLAMQGVREPVATYKAWQSLGRQVRFNEKAYRIIRPIVVKRTREDAQGEEHEVAYRRFKEVACLFAVSQTDGDELPPVEPKGWDLPAALAALNVEQVPYESADGNMQGYSSERTFAINPVAVNPTHTTFHELAHIVLGHTTADKLALYIAHRGVFEFEAEATAYLVMHELGLLDEAAASHSRAYIQGWLSGHEAPSDAVIRQVFQAVDKILKAGRPAKVEKDVAA